MQIGLIEARNPDCLFKNFSYSLQLGYLASYIKKLKPDTEFFIAEELDELLEYKPDIAGISSYSLNYDIAVKFAEKIKEKLDIPVILGGCHISSLPETFHRIFDAAVLGEGEETFFELIDMFEKHGKLITQKMKNIRGILFVEDDNTVITEPRPMIRKINSIPPPARSLFKIRSGTHYISTSRGCPFQCIFCSPKTIWGNVRSFTIEYILKEIGGIVGQFSQYLTHLMIVDDLFAADRKRLKKLHDLYINAGLNEVIILQANVRSDLVDDELAQVLKDMNFQTVNFGAESGSDRILKYYNKHNTVENNQRAIDILYKHGIKAIPSFIIGAPEETKEDLDATLEFIEMNHEKLSGFEIFPIIPMPGSYLWKYASEKGIVHNHMDWSRLEPQLLDFDPDRYLFLTEKIDKREFIEYVEKFKDMYVRYNPLAIMFRNNLLEMKKEPYE